MAKEKILLIEDEKNIAELVKYNLEQAGYTALISQRGDEGLALARQKMPDLILLDLMLSGMDGLDVCKALRADYRTARIPIIMLTAKTQEADRVIGLELGADDYVPKPFSPRELLARIKAVRRRLEDRSIPEILTAGTLCVDTAKHIVTLKSKSINLTSKEYDLLKILMESKGRVLSRDVLLERVWGYDKSINIETRTVDMHIGQLRKKIKHESSRILTVKNVGYRFDCDSFPR